MTSDDNSDLIKAHLKEHKFNDVNVGSISPEEMRKSRMLFTPMTLVINADGEVKKVWAGLWKNGNLGNLEQ
ncbi:MAG: hypothetical protein WBD22_08645 [Pyrinomonadaceae bacterium]